MQPSPVSRSRTFPSPLKEAPYQSTRFPSPSSQPLASANLSSISGFLCCGCFRFCICTLSPSMMFSRPIHIIASVGTSFHLVAKQYSSVYVYRVQFPHLPVGWQTCGLFPLWAVKTSAAVSVCFVLPNSRWAPALSLSPWPRRGT